MASLANLDINEWLVAQGLALAYRRYSHDYVAAEDEARAAGRGMWGGTFEPPWEWRRR
jgi:endonuclease YncB( thermonuclease family)